MPRARLPQLHSITDGSFEPNRKNPILLGDDDVLDTHQKVIKIGGENTPLSLNKDELRINGDLFLNGKLTSHLVECDSMYLTFRPNVYTRFESTDSTGTLDLYISGGDTYLLTSGDDFYFIGTSSGIFNYGILGVDVSLFQINTSNSTLTLKDTDDPNDLFSLEVAEHGVTNLRTTDDSGAVAHMSLIPDGDLILDPVSDTVTIVSNLTVGVDDAGYDVKFFGDTASNYMLWDTSADCLHLVTTNASTSQLIIESTDDGSNHSPDISIYRNSASPADSDTIGRIMFHGEDSGGNQTLYASIKAKADDVTAGSESGRLELRVAEYNGGLSTGVRLTGSATVDGDVDVEIPSGNFTIDATKKLYFDGGTHTYLDESSDDVLDIVVGADKMLILDEANDKITMGATNWVAGTVSGDTVTEFSVANSAYAGMIIGYRMIGEDASRTTYTLTTSFVVPDDDMGIRFIAPPSGAVEIMIQIKVDAQANNTTFIGLSTANATSGYSTAGATYEQAINLIDETDNATIQHYWAVTGLTAGDTYNYWVGFKKQSSGIGNGYLNWGGGSGEHCDFIMKATALPTAVSDFAEYD